MKEAYETHNYEETFALGSRLAKALKPGDVLFLSGELGSGKTAFCCGLANGLACIDEPASPTYSIVNVYRGPLPLAHFDMYRINTEVDLESSGYFDYLEQGIIVAVEWYENIAEFTAPPTYYITLKSTEGDIRNITIERTTE